ncbi:TIGR03749 family integrating conjugative element protein [Legionella sp.]|uniref:TIGR03749 family integrating conjugative element protein n=1 Tax=Legionella sp. TaxID=459 RepID=UPI000CC12404|nr:TIGR03749 family integrating conjugative element protein [Legionella sp.]PJE14468.1 MAG: TIGR03749 family integrating conjugative element protein [Legionella sp.]
MIFKRWMAFLMLCVGSAHAQELPAQHVAWDKTPIHITLPLNQERLIRFPLAISIVDSELDKDVGVMKIQDALYLNARAPIINKRLVVQLMPFGEVIIFSISANKEATDAAPIEVLVAAGEEDSSAEEHEQEEAPTQAPTTKAPEVNPVSLTRFAIQSLYAPERLLVTPPGVARSAMRTHKNIALVYGASIMARPVISWQGGDLYVTAIELKNELKKRVVIDPHQLVGNWQTATFFPTNTLESRGRADTTTVFVVSDRPFGEALSQTQEFVR